jgi:hypothetical protein
MKGKEPKEFLAEIETGLNQVYANFQLGEPTKKIRKLFAKAAKRINKEIKAHSKEEAKREAKKKKAELKASARNQKKQKARRLAAKAKNTKSE